MGQEEPKPSSVNPRKPKNRSRPKKKAKKGTDTGNRQNKDTETPRVNDDSDIGKAKALSASQQLSFFLDEFQSANRVQLSSLELESIKDTCILELSQGLNQDANTIGEHLKGAFKPFWKEVLYDGQLVDGKVEPGSPAALIISASALRSLELLRGLWLLTKECPAAKLFSKHMKVHEQVSLLKYRTNIAAGTPNRIKKLIDLEALGLSRIAVIVLDLHRDVKGYTLFTLPQVRDEFWDLYRSYFHEKLVGGKLRLCLYGQIPSDSGKKRKRDSKI